MRPTAASGSSTSPRSPAARVVAVLRGSSTLTAPPDRTRIGRVHSVVATGCAAALLTATACSSAPETGEDGSSSAPPSTRAAHAHSSTGDQSELVADLPVRTVAGNAGKRVILFQQVTIEEGQVVLAIAEFQTTNDLGLNVFVGSQVLLAQDAGDVIGREITAANGENVTPGMHHGQQSKAGTYEALRSDAGVRHVNLVAWAAASGATSGDVLAVDRGYGRLSVVRW